MSDNNSVKRYELDQHARFDGASDHAAMALSGNGDWVSFQDYKEQADRIEELEAKLALSEGALDVASRSWGECQRILEQTEAKLAKCEALMHAGLAEYQRRLVRAVRLIQFLDKEYQHVWGVTAKSEVRTVLAELEGELDE